MDERDVWDEPYMVDGKPCRLRAGSMMLDSAKRLRGVLEFEDGSTMIIYSFELNVLEQERRARIDARFAARPANGDASGGGDDGRDKHFTISVGRLDRCRLWSGFDGSGGIWWRRYGLECF